MKKFIAAGVVAAMLICCLPLFSACADDNTDKLHAQLAEQGYELVFEDNFDGDSIDYTKWRVGYNVGKGKDGALRRAGYYEVSEDTIDVSDGVLTVSTLYKDGQYGKGWYTCWLESSVLGSKGSEAPILCDEEDYRGFESAYGYFEARCIAPPCEGIWSAFWMMPNSDGMTDSGVPGGADGVEVDVMESPYYNSGILKRNRVVHALHGDGYTLNKTERSEDISVSDMYSTFHTYGVLWTPEEYVFYVDGNETWRTTYNVDGEHMGVSHVPQYMILSVEVGGYATDDAVPVPGKNPDGTTYWCGDAMNNDLSKSYDFVIDYVKVFCKA